MKRENVNAMFRGGYIGLAGYLVYTASKFTIAHRTQSDLLALDACVDGIILSLSASLIATTDLARRYLGSNIKDNIENRLYTNKTDKQKH